MLRRWKVIGMADCIQIGILEPHDFPRDAIDRLKAVGEVELFNGGKLKEFLGGKNVIFVRLNYYLGESFLSKATRLKTICSPTTGLTHVDERALTKRQVKLISLKDRSEFLEDIRATPEHTLGLILALLRNYKSAINPSESDWNRDLYLGEEIREHTFGFIGYGRVGRMVAKFLYGMDAKIHYYDVKENIHCEYGESCDSLESLLAKSSFVLLTASLDKSKPVILDETLLEQCEGKYLINIARGELLDEITLLRLARSGFFKGLGLDVLQDEHMFSNRRNRFRDSAQKQNIILTPHIGGATLHSRKRVESYLVELYLKQLNES